jgi:hypothetical protein
MGNRVVLFLTFWLAVWIGVGAAIGALFGTPGTGAVDGFVFAIVTTFLWPWIMPSALDQWMDGGGAAA